MTSKSPRNTSAPKEELLAGGPEEKTLENDAEDPVTTEIDPTAEKSKKFLDKFAVLILPWFALNIIGVITMWIVGFVETKDILWGIIGLNLLTAIIGAWAVYMYGAVQDQINEFKQQNTKLKHNLDDLEETKDELSKEVSELDGVINSMKTEKDALKENVDGFAPLIEELKGVCGDSEDLNAMLDDTLGIFNSFKKAALHNQMAEIYQKYYEFAGEDRDAVMNADEYEGFLGSLQPKYREVFEKMGGFEVIAQGDGTIDLQEFQGALNILIKEIETDLQNDFGNE